MDTWLELAPQVQSGASLEAVCASLSDFLALRTLLVGHTVTVADLAIWGQLQGELVVQTGGGGEREGQLLVGHAITVADLAIWGQLRGEVVRSRGVLVVLFLVFVCAYAFFVCANAVVAHLSRIKCRVMRALIACTDHLH